MDAWTGAPNVNSSFDQLLHTLRSFKVVAHTEIFKCFQMLMQPFTDFFCIIISLLPYSQSQQTSIPHISQCNSSDCFLLPKFFRGNNFHLWSIFRFLTQYFSNPSDFDLTPQHFRLVKIFRFRSSLKSFSHSVRCQIQAGGSVKLRSDFHLQKSLFAFLENAFSKMNSPFLTFYFATSKAVPQDDPYLTMTLLFTRLPKIQNIALISFQFLSFILTLTRRILFSQIGSSFNEDKIWRVPAMFCCNLFLSQNKPFTST